MRTTFYITLAACITTALTVAAISVDQLEEVHRELAQYERKIMRLCKKGGTKAFTDQMNIFFKSFGKLNDLAKAERGKYF